MTKLSDAERFLQDLFPNWRNRAAFAGNTLEGGWYETRKLEDLDPAGDCYVSIGAFAPGAKRRDGALEVVFLVIDDVGEKVPEAAVIKGLGLRPTFSILSSAVSQQWVYKLSAPIPVAEWPGFFRGIKKLVGVANLDGPEAVHVFRLPMGTYSNQRKPERHGFKPRIGEHNPATVLDVDLIAPVHDKITVEEPASEGTVKKLSRERLRELVVMIPNMGEVDSRNPWIGVAAGIKAQCENDADGFEIWDEWCQTWPGDGKNSYDPDETWKAWDSLKDGKIKAEGGMLRARAEAADPGRFAQWKAKVVFDDETVPPGPPKPATAGITATPFKWVDLARTAPRDWLYGDILLRKFISMTVAPGGVGKSSLVAVETLAQVTGKSLLGEDPSDELRVWLWNLEDPYTETQKKILAAAKHYGVTEAEIGDRLFVDSGRDQRLVVADMYGGTARIIRPVISALVEQIRLKGIDVVVIDPFVSCHGVPENDNSAMDMVVKEWGRVAEEGNCAVHLVDHTRKAGADAEVSTESSRGAKAKTDAARVVRVVNRMSAADGRTYGISDTWRYFNTFNDKANMAPPKSRRDWFRMASVWAGNGGGAQQAFSVGAAAVPSFGDSVGVAVKWDPPNAQALATGDAFKDVVEAMGDKRWRNEPRSPNWIGNAIASGLRMGAPSISNKVAIKTILKTWISEGLLKVSAQMDENRKMRDYIVVGKVF